MLLHFVGFFIAMLTQAEWRLPPLALVAEQYAESGKHEQAIQLWSSVLAFAPEQEVYWFKRGIEHSFLGNRQAMIRDFSTGFKLFPFSERYAIFQLLQFEDNLDSESLIAMQKAAVKEFPDCVSLLNYYGWQLLGRQRTQEALQVFNRSIRLKPRNNEAFAYRAFVHIANSNNKLAEGDLQKYIAYNSNDALARQIKRYLQAINSSSASRLFASHFDRHANPGTMLPQFNGTSIEQVQKSIILKDNDGTEMFDSRAMEIPISVSDKVKKNAKWLKLYVSTDKGKQWQLAALARPEDNYFSYEAPSDGFFWFSMQYTDHSGKDVPGLTNVEPYLKLKIDTSLISKKTATDNQEASKSASKQIELPPLMLPPGKK